MVKRTRLLKSVSKKRKSRFPKLTDEIKIAYAEREKNLPSAFQTLKRKLLSFNGIAVVPLPDEDLQKILSRGKLFVPHENYKYEILRGRPINCHANAAEMWKRSDGKVRIVTGWALTDDDGLWRQHSWALFKDKIIETTVKRLKYFGFVLNEKESQKFYDENV